MALDKNALVEHLFLDEIMKGEWLEVVFSEQVLVVGPHLLVRVECGAPGLQRSSEQCGVERVR